MKVTYGFEDLPNAVVPVPYDVPGRNEYVPEKPEHNHHGEGLGQTYQEPVFYPIRVWELPRFYHWK